MGPRKPAAVGIPVTSHVRSDKSDQSPQQTQLQFSQNAPALPENLAARFTSPHPIVIEKLKPADGQQDQGAGNGLGSQDLVPFAVISEEKLNRAVHLARRDVKRRHLEEQVRQQLAKREKCPATRPRSVSEFRASRFNFSHERQAPEKVEATACGAKVYLCTPPQGKLDLSLSDSPPTHDPGPGPRLAHQKKEDRSVQEVRHLQRELQNYIRKIEELAKRERREDILEPEEERRTQVWRQEQAARSARILYVLQQQVKEIEEDLEKLNPCKIKHTKKSQAMARLAAAHRGAIRALQMFVGQFATQSRQQLVPAHCKELGNLIRQLSLCSARLEMDSAIPDVIIELLLQIEDLESLLSKKEAPLQRPKGPSTSQAASPADASKWPKREKPSASEPPKPVAARRLLPGELQEPLLEVASSQRSALCNPRVQEGLLPPKHTSPQAKAEAPEKAGSRRMQAGLGCALLQKKGASFSTRPQERSRPPRRKALPSQAKQARFREPTIAFRLKESKPAVRESRSPWIPPSPPSSRVPAQRHLERSPKGGEQPREGKQESPEKEAFSTGNEGVFATRTPERVEQAVQEHLEPPLAKAQELNLSPGQNTFPEEALRGNQLPTQDIRKAAADILACDSEALGLKQRKETELDASSLLSASDLETMLQRMEEMERYQEAVCRRYHSIVYSDPEFWAQKEARERGTAAGGQALGTPRPIQITKPDDPWEPQADIVFEKPVDTNTVGEVAEREESPEHRVGTGQPSAASLPPKKETGTFLSVPRKMLQSISDYGARYEQHLKHIAHEAVGSFDPWHITQSLAEELMEEALADVAAELQDLCEDCAEAVFTSEFLQATEASS